MAYYTTVSRVRAESGLSGNVNILDATIELYITRAHSEVISMVARKYQLDQLTGSNFTSSPAESYLEAAECLIASGLLFIKEYGRQGIDSDKDGYKKSEEGRKMLRALYTEPTPIQLIGVDNKEFPKVASVSTSGGIVASGCEPNGAIMTLEKVF